VELLVDEWDDRHRTVAAVGLRDQPVTDRVRNVPFGLGKKPAMRHFLEALFDDRACLLVPRRGIPFFENIVGREALAKPVAHGALTILRAPSPASATPVNDGGAGNGGPFNRFWLQLLNPPMLRLTPKA
jgi:hypothetical protein